MAGNIRIPWKTLELLSTVPDPEAYKIKVREIIGNHMPKVFMNHVLLAVYISPEWLGTTGKLVRTPESIAEDIWQSKVGLIIRKGPAAFVDDVHTCFYGDKLEEGMWVGAAVNNCAPEEINGMPCRYVEDRFIRSEYLDPRAIW